MLHPLMEHPQNFHGVGFVAIEDDVTSHAQPAQVRFLGAEEGTDPGIVPEPLKAGGQIGQISNGPLLTPIAAAGLGDQLRVTPGSRR